MARTECRELRFIHNGKSYFAIGFPNRSGGYEVRNRYFKGCVAPKDITHIRKQGKQVSGCCLFEVFLDYLSYLTMQLKGDAVHKDFSHSDFMVLNSVTNMDKAVELLKPYSRIDCYLDNDKAGKEACLKLQSLFGERVNDMSVHYSDYKDMNDFLCRKMINESLKQEQKKGKSNPSAGCRNQSRRRNEAFGYSPL